MCEERAFVILQVLFSLPPAQSIAPSGNPLDQCIYWIGFQRVVDSLENAYKVQKRTVTSLNIQVCGLNKYSAQ